MYDADKVRALNDAARSTLAGCRVTVTQGVAALQCVDHVLAEVRSFSDFTSDNDPFSEHDFGSLQVAGQTLFWKFDYYDLTMTMLSADPADPRVTVRVLTIMLSHEY
jgi:hypothetical protein